MNVGRLAMGALSLALCVFALLALDALSERLSLSLTTEVLIWHIVITGQVLLGGAAALAVHRFSRSAPWLVGVLGAVVVISRLTFRGPFGAEPWTEMVTISLELAAAFAASPSSGSRRGRCSME